jgi:L-lactate dehydrogenase complex protein LldG
MTRAARENILARLQDATRYTTAAPEPVCLPIESLGRPERIQKLKSLMEAVRSEVHLVAGQDWVRPLIDIVRQKNLKTLLYGPDSLIGKTLDDAKAAGVEGLPQLVAYTESIEDFKETLFKVDAGITSTRGAIAETGAIVLWPEEKEPRLLSLVPPVHIAILEADKIFDTFCEMVQTENWPEHMPTNAVLVSGPSKTADIELVLAFGVHGPKELVVLILEN